MPRQGYEVLRFYASSIYNDPIVHEREIIQPQVQYFSDDFLCGHFSLSLRVISSDIWVLATDCPGPNPLIHKFRITTLLSQDTISTKPTNTFILTADILEFYFKENIVIDDNLT